MDMEKKMNQTSAMTSEELSDDDLDKVAGGMGFGDLWDLEAVDGYPK